MGSSRSILPSSFVIVMNSVMGEFMCGLSGWPHDGTAIGKSSRVFRVDFSRYFVYPPHPTSLLVACNGRPGVLSLHFHPRGRSLYAANKREQPSILIEGRRKCLLHPRFFSSILRYKFPRLISCAIDPSIGLLYLNFSLSPSIIDCIDF